MVACLARLLLEMGERPAVLSRGYGRRRADDGVVVVRDAEGVRADLDRAGDEPLMLARQLPGAAVLVSPDRYLAGRVAEQHLGATVHVLDDGFQHLHLDRDLDLVIVGADDVDGSASTLPAGRLREMPDSLIAADAVFAEDDRVLEAVSRDAVYETFRLRRVVGTVDGGPVMAVAGIAGPERFFEDLRAAGHQLVATAAFRDHHRYSRADLDRLVRTARAAGAARFVTTEKDFVRLLPFRPFPLPIAWLPLTMEPDPLPEFRRWLAGALNAARDIVT